jgi:hypothetical protein
MKTNTRKTLVPTALVVVMVAFLSTIFLVNADPSFAASGKKKSPEAVKTSAVEHTEGRIKMLQSTLKISESQQTLWNNLTAVMRENAKEMDALSKDRAENTKGMNAVEHLKFHTQTTEAHLAQQKRFITPFEALYTSMTDEQKQITDTIFRTGKHGKNTIK